MEPQINITCCRRQKRKNCLELILSILIALFLFTIGLLLGAALAGIILENLAYFIVLSIILGLLVALIAIYIRCSRGRSGKRMLLDELILTKKSCIIKIALFFYY